MNIDQYKKYRPLLTRGQIKDVLGFIDDQVSQGATLGGTAEQVFCTAADHLFPPDSIGMHVKELRKARRLSQESLARLSAFSANGEGVSRSTIHNIEGCRSMTDAAKLLNALCVGLEITPNELLSVYGYNWTNDG